MDFGKSMQKAIVVIYVMMTSFLCADRPPLDLEILQEQRENKLAELRAELLESLKEMHLKFIFQNQKGPTKQVSELLVIVEKEKLFPPVEDQYPDEVKEVLQKGQKARVRVDEIYQKSLEGLLQKYIKKGDLEASILLRNLLGKTRNDLGRNKGLAEIKVSANVEIAFKEMRKGRQRLSGGYRPGFDAFDDVIAESFFVRVPWQSKVKMDIKVEKSGNVFLIVGKKERESVPEYAEEVPKLVKGPYLDLYAFYRVYLEEGQELKLQGFEATVIAGMITK